MPAKIRTQTIVILWEHEIRIAAKALHKLKGKKVKPEDLTDALKACWAAIYHPDLVQDKPLTIMSASEPLYMAAKGKAH